MVQIMVIRVDIGVVSYDTRVSVVQFMVVRVDVGVATYEAMKQQCGRSVVQVLGCQSGYMSDDI